MGGRITVERMVKLVAAWPQPRPLVVALTEIRLAKESSLWEYQREIWKATQGEWCFILSQEVTGKKWGVGMLVSSQITPRTKPPPLSELIKGRLMACKLRLHHDWSMTTVAVCYALSVKEERMVIEEEVSKIMDKPLLMGGDFNGITPMEESAGTSRENLMWGWLREKEDQVKLVDCVKLGFKGPPPFTRVRRYNAT